MDVTSQVYMLYIYIDMVNTKRSTSNSFAINPSITHYYFVQFIVVLTNLNVPNTLFVDLTNLVQIGYLLCCNTRL